jgi:hypothetical protein
MATAAGLTTQLVASNMQSTAQILTTTASYERRREEWRLQLQTADLESQQLAAEVVALEEQIEVAHKQFALAQTLFANAEAVYRMQQTKFTNQKLYDWMTAMLSSLYYKMYDAALPLCFMAKTVLGRELGDEKSAPFFVTPSWNDLYQGLLAGETLLSQLQYLENVWMQENKRGSEVVKTVSLDTLIRDMDVTTTFTAMLKKMLSGSTSESVDGVTMRLVEAGTYRVTLDLSKLNIRDSYHQMQGVRRIKNIAVTLPALLKAYQDVEATLTLSGQGEETVALSTGVDDSGLFVTNFEDARFLPFEGADPSVGTLEFNLFNIAEGENQRDFLESLTDIIYQIRYVIR